MSTGTETYSLDERRDLCASVGITLDGMPAAIAGAQLDYAHVRQLPDGLSREYAWQTVARVVAAGGAFAS